MRGLKGFLGCYADFLGVVESMAMGQPITLAKRLILGPAATWRYYAGFVLTLRNMATG